MFDPCSIPSPAAIAVNAPKRSRPDYRRLPLVGIALLATGLVSCGGEVPLTAPAGTELLVSANPTAIPAERGESVITVTGFKAEADGGGTLSDGTQVFFSTTVGVIDERVAMQSGVARAILKSSGRSGQARVTVSSGNGIAGAEILVDIGTSGDVVITVTANPASLAPSDASSAIVATVTDVNNNVVADVALVFSTSAGALASAGAILRTNQQGQAFDRLTLINAESATVTARSGAASGTVDISRDTLPSPVIASVFPSSGAPGQRLNVTVSGLHFQPGATVSFGAGIGVEEIGFVNPSTLTAAIVIDAGAANGSRSVVVTNPDSNTVSFASGFAVGEATSSNAAPTCSMTVSPISGGGGTSVAPFELPGGSPANFNAAGTQDPDGTIVLYAWDFGDGALLSTTSPSASHSYATGTFATSLTATDNDGAQCSLTQFVREP